MSNILETVKSDMVSAMKAKDRQKLNALRNMSVALQEEAKQGNMDNETFIKVLDGLAKKRNQSIAEYKKAGRNDLVENEGYELKLINSYLPKRMSLQDIEAVAMVVIEETGAESMKDMGAVMKAMKDRVGNDAKPADISQVIKKLLS